MYSHRSFAINDTSLIKFDNFTSFDIVQSTSRYFGLKTIVLHKPESMIEHKWKLGDWDFKGNII